MRERETGRETGVKRVRGGEREREGGGGGGRESNNYYDYNSYVFKFTIIITLFCRLFLYKVWLMHHANTHLDHGNT